MNKALAKLADTTLSQIQRVVKGESAARLDTIERIAKALEVRPQDLLTPYFVAQQKAKYGDDNPDSEELRRSPGE